MKHEIFEQPGDGAVAINTAVRTRQRTLFAVAVLCSSFLLFLVQPMIARMALPRLGGAPAVWNSAMLVYQALLLGGYGYAHMLGRLRPRVQAVAHLGVLAFGALWLPIGLVAMAMPGDAQPALWVPWLLGLSIGPLFFAIAAQAPLLQRWFGLSSPGDDPYALYAASNIGSFAGLIAYPLIVEPMLAVHGQSFLWSSGYVLVVLLVAVCALSLPRRSSGTPVVTASPAPSAATVLGWIGLAFVPSGLMLATTTFLTTDIVAMPMLWVIPLGLYLLSFSVAFAARRGIADAVTRLAPLVLLLFGGVAIGGFQAMPYLNAALALVLLFVVSVALHTAMYRRRPGTDRLTGFYLAMSFGGALGGVFAGLLAPVLFNWTWEYPLLVLCAGACVPQSMFIGPLARLWAGGAQQRRIVTLSIAIALVGLLIWSAADPVAFETGPNRTIIFAAVVGLELVALGHRGAFMLVLAGALMIFGGYKSLYLSLDADARSRSYFGVYTVRGNVRERQLSHGTTIHGAQLLGSVARERTPTNYYVPQSGIGQAMQALPVLYGDHARVGVVGLGAGTLACYARPGQAWRFFEIDPVVVRIARDTGQFSFLRHCLPNAKMVIGDARINIAISAPHSLDLLALDAFSSDAVPMHLMTVEAINSYRRVLAPDGVLLFHISNRFVDLEPVLAAAAARGHWRAAKLVYNPATPLAEGVSGSFWVALSQDPTPLALLKRRNPDWAPLITRPGFAAWTDDYATILPLLK